MYASRACGIRRSVQDLRSQLGIQAKDRNTKRLGVALAAFCAATVCIGGMLVIAFVALLAGEGADPSTPMPPIPLVPSTPELPGPAVRDVNQEDLSDLTWKRLQRLEEAFAKIPGGRADAAAALKAAEEARDAEQKAWAAARAAETAAQRLAGGTSQPLAAADPTLDLGVDWAAWRAGAEIDHSHTTPGLHRGFWGRAARILTSMVPSWRMLVTASHTPEVVLTWETGPPSRCFAVEGSTGAKVSIIFWRPIRPSHVALEQSPSWALDPRARPRDFEVHAWPTGMDDPYSMQIGRFEFEGSSQVFNLTADVGLVRGLQFRFQRNWGEEHQTLICRLRVFGNQST